MNAKCTSVAVLLLFSVICATVVRGTPPGGRACAADGICPYLANRNPQTRPDNELPTSSAHLNVLFAHGQLMQTASMLARFPSAFLVGGKICPELPHVRASTPFGHLEFTSEITKRLTAVAQGDRGVLTLWMGAYPVFYVATRDARERMIAEKHIGNTDAATARKLAILMGNNRVMRFFPAFQPIISEMYKQQRTHLVQRFDHDAAARVPKLFLIIGPFLEGKQGKTESIRKLITELVLETSSSMLGLTDWPLQNLLKTDIYAAAIENVAHYGISEPANREFEVVLYNLFTTVLANNFKQIASADPAKNLVRMLFASHGVDFPANMDEFNAIAETKRYNIAMTFASIGLGAKVHSTINTLDWAVARLLHSGTELVRLTKIVRQVSLHKLGEASSYNMDGPLVEVAKWVGYNVFLNPPFGHQFFMVPEPRTVTLSDGVKFTIPQGGVVIANYGGINRGNTEINSAEDLYAKLEDYRTKTTIESQDFVHLLVHSQLIASFGGTKKSAENGYSSRVCPAAKTSLYEQMIFIALLLHNYDVQSWGISVEEDDTQHPLISRQNEGSMRISAHGAT